MIIVIILIAIAIVIVGLFIAFTKDASKETETSTKTSLEIAKNKLKNSDLHKEVIEKSEGISTETLDLSTSKEKGIIQLTDHIKKIIDDSPEKVKHLNKKSRKTVKKIIKE